MNTFNKIMGVIITIFIGVIVFFMGVKIKDEGEPNNLYKIYLNGDVIGLIENKEELLELIDKEQTEIKEKYKVDKVYPPSGLDIQSVVTYEDSIKSVNEVYNEIKNKEPFTISGYKVSITRSSEDEDTDEEENNKNSDDVTITLNVLKKEDFEEGLYNTMAAFVGSEALEKYKNNTQLEITDIGSTVENVYWKEDIVVKESYLSTKDFIYTNSSDISKYLLFGTLEDGKKYIVKEGDDISSVANANNLNVDEFLVANPTLTSANVLLTKGQVVNTALINPLVSVVYEVEKIEDVDVPYKTVYQDDDTEYVGKNTTIQEGQNGQTRVTEQIQYINGEIQGLYISKSVEITPAVDKVVKRGTKKYNYSSGGNYTYHDVPLSNDSWGWPTITPYVITSRFYWRWGRQHEGIDISGCGHGSPIFSIADGIVTETGRGSAMGIYAIISHGQDYYSIYMHMNKVIVSAGQTVKRGQQIGGMGNTGRSTGTHLHLGIYKGVPYKGGTVLDPCKSVFSC